MSDITRIIFRQGSESERSGVVLLQGEPGYTFDAKRLYIGDGNTVGGVPVGIRNLGYVTFGPVNSNVNSNLAPASGDLVYDMGTNVVYALTGTDYTKTASYRRFGTSLTPDNVTIANNNGTISVAGASLNFSYFNTTSIGQGLEFVGGNTVLQLTTPSPELSFLNNVLQITNGSVANSKLSNMGVDTVKARLTTAGSPADVPLATFATALAPLITSPGNTIPPGTVFDYAGTTAPTGYLLCDGSAVNRTTYSALFNILGTTWGVGDGSTTFNIPDLRGRTSIGAGQGGGLTNRTLGQTLGTEQHILTVSEMPAHTHNVQNNSPSSIVGTDGIHTVQASATTSSIALQTVGGTQPHNNIQPSAVLNKIIKT